MSDDRPHVDVQNIAVSVIHDASNKFKKLKKKKIDHKKTLFYFRCLAHEPVSIHAWFLYYVYNKNVQQIILVTLTDFFINLLIHVVSSTCSDFFRVFLDYLAKFPSQRSLLFFPFWTGYAVNKMITLPYHV